MKKALLVTNSEQSAALLKQLLREEGYDDISVFFAAYSAREEDDVYDLICINALLPDENGIQLAKYFADTTRAAVVIIVPKNGSDEISDVLNGKGVLVIAKPIQRHLFHHYLLFADCFRSRLLRLERENEKLKHMVEDLKIIDRDLSPHCLPLVPKFLIINSLYSPVFLFCIFTKSKYCVFLFPNILLS